jgi:phage baseplate assembly protein gpV
MYDLNEKEYSDIAHLYVGLISDTDPAKGKVRVKFDADTDDDDDDNPAVLVSDWIPFIVRKSQNDKETFPFDINEQVWCVMDEFCEEGIVIGATYNDTDKPDGAGNNIYRILYKDGSYEQFDRSSSIKTNYYKEKLHNETGGGAIHEMTSKHSIKNTSDSVQSIFSDMMDMMKLMTFTNGAGTTGPANNITVMDSLKTRFNNLFV